VSRRLPLIAPSALVREPMPASAWQSEDAEPAGALTASRAAASASDPLVDSLRRPLHDLRLSVTDRCNLRCSYCMPKEVYGPGYPFLPRSELLTFEELRDVAATFVELGVQKLRITGGEPLLRAQLPKLLELLAPLGAELALTTNGVLLEKHAAALRASGLNRVTVSLDALDPAAFERMSGTEGVSPKAVLAGIDAAVEAGLSVKVNTVVRRGVNEDQVMPLVRHFRGEAITVRFIEYMDVGSTNGWNTEDVVASNELRQLVHQTYPIREIPPAYAGEVSRRYVYEDGNGEVGFISSVTKPFCGDCSRARVSAKGTLYTCLFAANGVDLRDPLRKGGVDALRPLVERAWRARTDRYSEQRGKVPTAGSRIEMSYIGG
jgi:cyclic pyranopterin phosphate synthase